MAVDKVLLRIEAKIDALLEEQGLDPAEFGGGTPAKRVAPPAPKLTPQQREAIANAPGVTPAVHRNENVPAGVAPPAPTSTLETGAPPTADAETGGEPNAEVDELADLGLTAEQQAALIAAGYVDRAALVAATDDDLIAVTTIGKATVTNLRAKLK